MEIAEHIDVLHEQGVALAAAASAAGLDAPVPTCPRWRVRHLLGHVGTVHRWAATHVREGKVAVAGGRQPPFAKPPKDERLDWFVEGHAALVQTLRAAPPDVDSWSFLPAPSALAFWARRQAHETAIHRADAASALQEAVVYDTAFAADGLDELLCGFMARPGGTLKADPQRTLSVDALDAHRYWHVVIGPAGRQITTHAGPAADMAADCAIRGSASDLYQLLWNRIPHGRPEIAGDADVVKLWRQLARVRWR
ncbi:MAG: hypothetical protein QOJ62_1092 [Actinomycetota bacterium]|nr:hypothetical protein [Actinomycetota bacterium]